jgi:hypothetical protein
MICVRMRTLVKGLPNWFIYVMGCETVRYSDGIDRLRSWSRADALARSLRSRRPQKKAVETNKRQQACCRPPPVCE